MGLLGRQFNLEREFEDSLLLALSTLTFTISLFAYLTGINTFCEVLDK